MSIKAFARVRREPSEVARELMAAHARRTAPGIPIKSTHTADALSADDLECLWAIARRTTLQDRLVEVHGRRLQKKGLIELTHEWPTLTPHGRRILKEVSARAILDLHRESDSGE